MEAIGCYMAYYFCITNCLNFCVLSFLITLRIYKPEVKSSRFILFCSVLFKSFPFSDKTSQYFISKLFDMFISEDAGIGNISKLSSLLTLIIEVGFI